MSHLFEDPTAAIVLGLMAELVLVVLLAGLASGSYTAFVLSRFAAARVLRGSTSLGGQWLRKGLVIGQFAVTVVLIFCTLVVHEKLQFVQERDPGFDREGMITMPIFSMDRIVEGKPGRWAAAWCTA